jgi:hypothetical protein
MRSVFFLTLLFFAPFFSYAQVGGFVDTANSIQISPAFPSPNEEFTVTLNDYSGGAAGSSIEWYYNDTKLEWAFNQRSLKLTATKAGQTGIIKAVLKKPSGETESLSHTITPYNLDIIIEPQTHVPSFYKGRALPSAGSTVNATALISSDALLTGEFLYTWQLNRTVINGGPMRGGDRVSFVMPQDSYSTLAVTVSRLNGSIIAKRTISVPVVAPKLLFYEVSTLYGIFEKVVTNPFSLISNSMTLRAEPYYLDSAVFNTPNVLTWDIEGQRMPSGSNPYDITLEKTPTGGSAVVEFRVQSTTKLLQGAKGTIRIDVL